MSARWRVFVWRSAGCEPHIPDRQTAEWPHMTRCSTCAVFYSLGNVSWENWNLFLLPFFSFPPLRVARMIGMLLFVSYHAAVLLSGFFSPISPYLTRLYPTPPVDVFFTDDLLWISNLQCSDCYRQQQCFSRAVKAELPPLRCLKVWHLHSMLLSVYRRKSGLMSVSGSLTKQSVALNMRVILVETVICGICQRGGENRAGGSTAAHWIYTPAGSSDGACLEAEA